MNRLPPLETAVFDADRSTAGEGRKRSKSYVLRRLWKYLSTHRLMIVLCILLVLLSNALALIGPSLSGKAIDAIGIEKGGVDFPAVFRYIGLMALCYLFSSLMSYALSYFMIQLSQKVVFRIRQDLFNSLTALPVYFFDTRQTGDIISVMSYDVDTIGTALSTDLIQIIKSAITIVGSLIMMLSIEPLLVLIFCVTVPLSMFFSRYITKKVRPLYRKRSIAFGEMNGFAEEMIAGQKTTRAYNREEVTISRFDEKNDAAVKAYNVAEYFGTLMGPSVNFINNVSLTLISVFGAILYIRGAIGLGNISSFVLYSRKFSGPINEIANIFGDLQSAIAAAERVFSLIDETPEKPDAANAAGLDEVRGAVELTNVEFGYVPEHPIIKSLSLYAKPGSLIAIVGPTGAGKTTIINLLMRFYDIDAGSLTLDGGSIYDIRRADLRRAYTMVLQDTWLFSGTVFENIAYSKENASMEEVVAAAKAARIHSYIMRLPDGYNTMLNDTGSNISKGQKQLMTIARAMLLDSHMLILDEATSNVDTRTEMQIQAAMRSLMKDKTCFVIAHRLSTIKDADLILVMQDGNVVEQGTHDELLKHGGVYSRLYYSQFEAY